MNRVKVLSQNVRNMISVFSKISNWMIIDPELLTVKHKSGNMGAMIEIKELDPGQQPHPRIGFSEVSNFIKFANLFGKDCEITVESINGNDEKPLLRLSNGNNMESSYVTTMITDTADTYYTIKPSFLAGLKNSVLTAKFKLSKDDINSLIQSDDILKIGEYQIITSENNEITVSLRKRAKEVGLEANKNNFQIKIADGSSSENKEIPFNIEYLKKLPLDSYDCEIRKSAKKGKYIMVFKNPNFESLLFFITPKA